MAPENKLSIVIADVTRLPSWPARHNRVRARFEVVGGPLTDREREMIRKASPGDCDPGHRYAQTGRPFARSASSGEWFTGQIIFVTMYAKKSYSLNRLKPGQRFMVQDSAVTDIV